MYSYSILETDTILETESFENYNDFNIPWGVPVENNQVQQIETKYFGECKCKHFQERERKKLQNRAQVRRNMIAEMQQVTDMEAIIDHHPNNALTPEQETYLSQLVDPLCLICTEHQKK